jgi:hypothetical protein
MPQATQIVGATPYASSGDFCRIFQEDINDLFQLSFLLTADREKAEQCFVSGLEDAVEGNPVFKDWARSWARRVIIQNSVRLIKPRPDRGNGHSSSVLSENGDKAMPTERLETAAILALEPFERFVYVITVLEHYSDHECSVLLGCARRDVLAARTRALQQLGSGMEIDYRTDAALHAPASHKRHSSVLELMTLATSAVR